MFNLRNNEDSVFRAVSAVIEAGARIGAGTTIWYFTHVMPKAVIGEDCSIGENVFIGNNVVIGNKVKVANGANLYDGTIVRDNAFIGNNVSFTNVKYPRAWRKANAFLPTIVEEGATIHANAVLAAGVRVGKGATVGEGAIVVRDVSEGGFVVSPAAQCICNREECFECTRRKEKNKLRQQYVERKT